MTLDKDHLFKRLAALELTKDLLERGPQGLRLDRIKGLAHRGITRRSLDAVDTL